MLQKIKVLEDIILMLTELEDEIFQDKAVAYYNGYKYLKSEWRNYIAVLKDIKETYESRSKASCKYLKKNAEYNRLHRKLSYYKRKKNKKPKDYKEIEKTQKALKRWMERKIEKKNKLKELEEEMEENRRMYDNDERGI